MRRVNSSPKPYRELLHIGLPIILGQVGAIFVSFADNIMVGHYATDAFASASFVNNLFALVFILGMGFSYGLTPLVTTAYTLRKYYKAGGLLRHSLLLNLALALVLSVAMLAIYFNLEAFDLPEHLHPIVRPYFLLQIASFVLYMLLGAFKQFFDGAGYTSVGMWIILLSNAINVLGNWLLIYGEWGLPELGLLGAGIATLISRVFVLVAFVGYFYQRSVFRTSWQGFLSSHCSPRNLSRLARLGSSVGMYSGVEATSFTIALLFVTKLGVIPLAVHQVLCVVTTIGFLIYYGLGAATTILVSRFRTMGDFDGVERATRVGLELSLVVAVFAMAVMWFGRHYIGYIFTKDEEMIAMVSVALIPVILYQVGDAMQVIYANALRGMEDVGYLAFFATLVHLGLEPILSYVFGFRLSLETTTLQLVGVWSAFPIGLLALGLLLRYRFRRIVAIERAVAGK
ncbi:MAG: MATE family efflux transporter [Porphyromonadaceae bacterium]|nr:MATE family efflux transporter [Porphyromonadaceae bacterium]